VANALNEWLHRFLGAQHELHQNQIRTSVLAQTTYASLATEHVLDEPALPTHRHESQAVVYSPSSGGELYSSLRMLETGIEV
jgi:hypothetical protein